MKIRVIVCDDHTIVREGLVALLRGEADLEVVAQAGDGIELTRLARELQPDVIVTDLSMPRMNGIEAIALLRQMKLGCKVLCLSVRDQMRDVVAALDAGASGYLLKHNSYAELAGAIRRVMANQTYISGELVAAVMAACRNPDAAAEDAGLSHLTLREREIVQMFSEGYSTREIAERLFVSTKTIATHREHVFRKLGIRSIAELTRYAVLAGLSTLDIPRRSPA